FSALDFAKAAERTAANFCRQGLGALLATLAEGVPVQLATPVKSIDTRRALAVETAKGTLTARAAIVTVSTNVIAAGGITFFPDAPHANSGAVAGLSLGSDDHIALGPPGNPLGLASADLVFEKGAESLPPPCSPTCRARRCAWSTWRAVSAVILRRKAKPPW